MLDASLLALLAVDCCGTNGPGCNASCVTTGFFLQVHLVLGRLGISLEQGDGAE